MNTSRERIELVRSTVPITKLEEKNNARMHTLKGFKSDGSALCKHRTIEVFEERLLTMSPTKERILIEMPLSVSGRLKRVGFGLIKKIDGGSGVFLLDLHEYFKYKSKEDFEVTTVEDYYGNRVEVAFSTELPSYFTSRLDDYALGFVDKVFSKKGVGYIELGETPKDVSQEKYLAHLVESNKTVFNYFGIDHVVIAQPYDRDASRWSGIRHSFVGRFKDISKSFVIIYLGQNKNVTPNKNHDCVAN